MEMLRTTTWDDNDVDNDDADRDYKCERKGHKHERKRMEKC